MQSQKEPKICTYCCKEFVAEEVLGCARCNLPVNYCNIRCKRYHFVEGHRERCARAEEVHETLAAIEEGQFTEEERQIIEFKSEETRRLLNQIQER